MRRLIVGFACLLPVIGPAAVAPAARGQEMELGLARVDITPDYPDPAARLRPPLEGVGRRRTADLGQGAGDRLGRRGPAVLVSVDNLGVSDAIVEEVAARLNRQGADLARERFAVGSSHTHSAPCLTGVAPNIFGKPIPTDEQAAIDRYTRELTDKLERGLPRRPEGHAGRGGSPGPRARSASRPTGGRKGGPVDHALPVLRATDPDGTLRGVVVNYACHCTTLDPAENTISGDWAGYAQEAIEADHPGAIALTVIGCGADANPTPRVAPGAAAAHGQAIADEVNRLLKGPWTSLASPPSRAVRAGSAFPSTPCRPARSSRRLVKARGPPGYNASTQLARLDRGEPLQPSWTTPVQTWQFGDELVMVFLAGEVVVDYVLRLKTELDAGRLWVTAYANDVPCYIPSERILREGGYEGGGAMVYYARPDPAQAGGRGARSSSPSTRVVPAASSHVAQQVRRRDASAAVARPSRCGRSATKPGLRVELVAAEPLVDRPGRRSTSAADGRLWVCEMRDYPTGIDGNWKPGGVIKVLEDRDGDGRYDTATDLPRRPPVPDRRHGLAQGGPDLRRARDPLRRGHRRRRQGRRASGRSSGASPPRTTRRGSTGCRTASTTGSTAPTA